MNKIATGLEQSKKLAEILPIDSADMYYHNTSIRGINYVDEHQLEAKPYNTTIGTSWFDAYKKYNPLFEVIPAWSLTALIDSLPSTLINDATEYLLEIYKNPDKSYEVGYFYKVWACIASNNENLVDACCEMICKLKEKNLI